MKEVRLGEEIFERKFDVAVVTEPDAEHASPPPGRCYNIIINRF
jgi:hypothetical protein